MSAVYSYLIPQVIADLDFYHVESSRDLAYRLRTLQRVAAAAIGTYLLYRYTPLLASQISHIPHAKLVANAASWLIVYTLCSPAAFLFSGGLNFYKGSVDIFSGIKQKDIGRLAWGSFCVLGVYSTSHFYRKPQFCCFPSPNFLDKVFIRVADRYAPFLWNRFYN